MTKDQARKKLKELIDERQENQQKLIDDGADGTTLSRIIKLTADITTLKKDHNI
jgi:flagellar biosynthesis chaperone FliJ